MRLVADISVDGFAPAPWSVPEICKTKSGHRFTKRRGRSNLADGIANLKDWQKLVSDAAEEAMGDTPPVLGPVRIEIDFRFRAPEGEIPGALCFLPLKLNQKTLEYEQTTIRGRKLGDLTNLEKGTEDALQAIVYHNDCQVVEKAGSRKWGGHGGCRIKVWLIEETYEDAHGEPSDAGDLRKRDDTWVTRGVGRKGRQDRKCGATADPDGEEIPVETAPKRKGKLRHRRSAG